MSSRGSEWKKWDLHIHTPASFHWNGGKKFKDMNPEELERTAQNIIEKINSSDVVAFSTMDYFTFDGILEIRKHLRQPGAAALKKTIFPGIELRVDAPVDHRLNIHAIFSESVTDQELADFKSALIISGYNRSLSDEGIIYAGRSLPADKAKEVIGNGDYKNNDDTAFELGIKTICVTRESLIKAVESISREKCLILLPYDTSDGIEKLNWKDHPHDDCYFLRQADIFETRNKHNIDLFLGQITDKNKDFIEHFIENMGGLPKPVVSGSDAHKINDYGVYPNDKMTWIKADPTFRGLLKTTIEPSSRTFIGIKPEKLKVLASKSTKFISKLEIKRAPNSKFEEDWFDNTLYFNPELVAIIGNKGSGKSALADIIGLLGNSMQENAFSFLNEKKFREKQGVKAINFMATMQWHSGDSINKTLADGTDLSSVEMIRYIPQSYLEKLCNEINAEGSLFDKELKSVIFSHINENERLGLESLDSLIKYRAEEINTEIFLLKQKLHTILLKIVESEFKLTDQYKGTLVNQVTVKQNELEAHLNSKPTEVPKPSADPSGSPETQAFLKEMESLRDEEKKLTISLTQKKSELEITNKKNAALNKLIQQINIIEKQYSQSISEIEPLAKEYGFDVNEIFIFEIYKEPVLSSIQQLQDQIDILSCDLDPEMGNSSAHTLVGIQNKIGSLAEKIDEPSKKYKAYIDELEKWNAIAISIQGDSDKPGTISYLNSLLSEIQNIPSQLTDLEEKRDDIVTEIFGKIDQKASVYRQFYAPVQDFVQSNPFGEDAFQMSFDVSIVDKGFQKNFFQYINRSRAGTFYGMEDSEKTIRKIMDKYNFNEAADIKSFTREILECMKFDCRDDKKKQVPVSSQLKDSKIINFYLFIFSLEYLDPKYSLKLNGKSVEQLSPGERGTLLLIFYLMVDKDDRPLVLDQPEENLDNQTIFKVLVPCIKRAKLNRQLFLVTHNPNLAVVCDAEQIIAASIDKVNKNKVKYQSGSIENPIINKAIVDILEGTRPAFDNRDAKYFAI